MKTQTRVTVFDIGGRGGMHRCWSHFSYPLAYYSFEPDPEEFTALSKLASAVEKTTNTFHILPYGVDGISGERLFNIYSNRAGCSFFENTLDGCYRFRRQALERKVLVPTISIDDLAEKDSIAPHFIAVDAEGAELDVLKGGETTLKSITLGVRCEVELSDIYRDAPEFDEVVGYMRSIGYQLCRIETCNAGMYGVTTDMNKYSVSPADALPLTADFIFINKAVAETILHALPMPEDERIFQLIAFAIHNGCGYRGMDFLETAFKAGHWATYQSAFPKRARDFASHVAAYISLPRSNINKSFEPASIFKSLTGLSYLDILASSPSSVIEKLSTIYNAELLFGRVMSPRGDYSMRKYE
jgi:FkbM family methyltransferase